jgi:histidinol-phosphate phosphatase family protein
MRAKHGPGWRARAHVPRGRLAVHVATVTCAAIACAGTATRRRVVRDVGVAGWLSLTLQFAWVRLRPGPRTARELAEIAVTSVAVPPAAVFHRVRGAWTERRRVRAVLFDRDGTLVVDVPYNGDPARVRTVPDADDAVARLRAHGMRVAVVSNQSGVARGLLTAEDVAAVNARVEELVGPLDGWWWCPHGDDDGCACRKPQPGLVRAAARGLGMAARRCVVIGDTIADTEAARRAGSRGILVPNAATRRDEITAARDLASDLAGAVDLVLGGRG